MSAFDRVAIRGLYARLYFDDNADEPQLIAFELCTDPACADEHVLGGEIDAAFVPAAFIAELLHAPTVRESASDGLVEALKDICLAHASELKRSELAGLGV